MLWHFRKMNKYSRGIGISHASFWYLTNWAQLPFSSAVRFWFQMIFQIILASFVPGLKPYIMANYFWAPGTVFWPKMRVLLGGTV